MTFHLLFYFDVSMYRGVSFSLLLTQLHYPLNCMALKRSFWLLWSKWLSLLSSFCFYEWCVLFLYIWNLFFCIFFFIYIYINWSICSVDDGFWFGGSELTSWAGDKMMKLHSLNDLKDGFSWLSESGIWAGWVLGSVW